MNCHGFSPAVRLYSAQDTASPKSTSYKHWLKCESTKKMMFFVHLRNQSISEILYNNNSGGSQASPREFQQMTLQVHVHWNKDYPSPPSLTCLTIWYLGIRSSRNSKSRNKVKIKIQSINPGCSPSVH